MSTDKAANELTNLRSSADSLAQCLGALLKRIEDLEEASAPAASASNGGSLTAAVGIDGGNGTGNEATAKMLRRIAAAISGGTGNEHDALKNGVEASRREFITIDPLSGAKKWTVVTERLIDTPPSPAGEMVSPAIVHLRNGGNTTGLTIFQPRLISVSRDIVERMNIQFFAGEAIVVRMPPDAVPFIRPGDVILEISGQKAVHARQFHAPYLADHVSMKLVPADIFALPANFCKMLDDYRANEADLSACVQRIHSTTASQLTADQPSTSHALNCTASSTTTVADAHLLPYLSFDLRKGDVIQIISADRICMQARKVDDLLASGFVPTNLRMERVALLSPYGRRVIALLGANGVGRRTLKRMLLQKTPLYFTSDVPLTSRAPKPGEIDGRDFHFVLKEHFHNLIRANQMIEWGESNGHLYGTSAENVRQVIRSGRVCVLDCTERALKLLYAREFAPYVVVIAAPPSVDELARVTTQRAVVEGRPPPTADMLRNTWEENERLMRSPYAKHFNLVLVNRNFDVTLRRLLAALEHLRNEWQWMPLEWLS